MTSNDRGTMCLFWKSQYLSLYSKSVNGRLDSWWCKKYTVFCIHIWVVQESDQVFNLAFRFKVTHLARAVATEAKNKLELEGENSEF